MASARLLRGSRTTNLTLAWVVPAALASGVLAFATGSGWASWVAIAHGALGLAIVVLSPWKTAISRRGVGRRGGLHAWPSIALGALVVVAVASGLLQSTGVLRSMGPLTTMQVHVASALAAIPMFAWHLFARPVRPRSTDLSRRALLRTTAVAGASVAGYAGVALLSNAFSLPGRDRRVTGSYEVAPLRPDAMPVTQWLDDSAPAPGGAWRLTVRTPTTSRTWTLGELDGFDDRVRAVLDCTGGWWSEQDWAGVRLSRLVPSSAAHSVVVRSATGYARRLPASDADALLLARRVGGEPISLGHGAPLRLVAPGRRGFWWVKWVTAIEADDTPWWWQPPFPLS